MAADGGELLDGVVMRQWRMNELTAGAVGTEELHGGEVALVAGGVERRHAVAVGLIDRGTREQQHSYHVRVAREAGDDERSHAVVGGVAGGGGNTQHARCTRRSAGFAREGSGVEGPGTPQHAQHAP